VSLQALKSGVAKNVNIVWEIEEFLEQGKGKRCKDGMLELKRENKAMNVLKHRIETMIDTKVLGFIV
jgi:hypothetical protein